MIFLIKLFLCALGNRCIGSSHREIGFLFMTFGVWVGLPLLAFPFISAGVLIWRVKSPRSWLDLTHGGSYWKGVLRGVLVLPLAAVAALFGHFLLPIFFGVLAIFAVPFIYYLAGKQTKYEPVALAEIGSGAIIGLI
jgi:hypothetical protein